MEDKELFDFFKNRSASFDEMPPDELWNKIQATIGTSKGTSRFSISKIIVWSVLSLATIATIVFFIPKNSKNTFENLNREQDEILTEMDSSTTIKITSKLETGALQDTVKISNDSLKTKNVLIKRALVTVKRDTLFLIKSRQPVFKTDSLQLIDPKIEIDSLRIMPQVKGNQLLFETKHALTENKFDSFVVKVLKETETDYGALIVIKAKGHKPYKHIVGFPERLPIPKVTFAPVYYTGKLILKDSLITNDSLYFDLKK